MWRVAASRLLNEKSNVTHISPDKTTQRHEEFGQLFRGSSDWLFNYLLSLLRDSTDAEDAFQETSRVCWQKLDQYDRSMEFRAWASGVAYFEAMKIFDRRKRQGIFCSEQFFETISSKALVMAHQLDKRSAALGLCLERLSEKDRVLIDQRYTFDASVQELAEGLGRSVHAIYRALRRIHDMLQRCINRSIAEP